MLTINARHIRNDVRRNLSVLSTTRQTSKRILITSNMGHMAPDEFSTGRKFVFFVMFTRNVANSTKI